MIITYKIAALWLLMVAAVMTDLWDGVYTSRKLGQPLQSRLLRKTVEKIVEYSRLLAVAAIIDASLTMTALYRQPYVTLAMTVGLAAIEWKSMMEHACRRRSGTARLSEIMKEIIKASTGSDAQNVVRMLNEFLNLSKKNEKNESKQH